MISRKMGRDELMAAVKNLPGGDGWWHRSNGETYQGIAEQLLGYQISPEDVLDILSGAYHAAANEFGS